tara:strand:+ start:774 stop:1313 length:540 start_codon:yes stop_codon:yes gene_type:complete
MSNRAVIRKIIEGIFAAYPRSSGITEGALDIWELKLDNIPLRELQKAAFKWIEEKKFAPDNVADFRRFVNYRAKQEEAELPGLEDFKTEYRKENPGLTFWSEEKQESVDSQGRPLPRRREGRKTSGYDAVILWGIIKDITDKKIRPPRSIAKHDIHAIDDAEERWFWNEFRRRKAAKAG